jgi:ATP-binding cassette subfamily F protein 3
MLKAANLYHSFGTQVLFEDVGFTIGNGERIGLIGRNGSGKTTLLNILAGLMKPERGTLAMPRSYAPVYMRQTRSFSAVSVLEEACLSLPAEQRAEAWRAEKVLSGLGFTADQFQKAPSHLSDGFQVRLELAKTLICGGNLLLLDEPNNYLDIVSIRWLERYLKSWKGELVLITHDRSFMDSVTTHTMMIHRKRIRKIRGGTEKLYGHIAQEEEIHEKTRINDEKRRREVELYIDRFRAKARLAGLVQSRIKSLQKRERMTRLEPLETLEFSFHPAPTATRFLMHVGNIGFSYSKDGQRLIDGFSLVVSRQDRIGVIGKNGRGKSTFLKLLAGELQPLGGTIRTHPHASMGHFCQESIDRLGEERSVEEELATAAPGLVRRDVLSVSGAMMFGGDLSQKLIGVLSGGERSRVLLGKLLLTPLNLLLLDEPTNHLDMESCDSLMSAIDRFDGAVLIATHNELFLHTLATRLVVFDGDDSPFVHEGGYRDFLEHRGWEDERGGGVSAPSPSAARDTNTRRELRIRRAELIGERSRALRPVGGRIAEIERAIDDLEREVHENNRLLIEASANGDGVRIQELSRDGHLLRRCIEERYEEFEALLEEQERISASFARKLENLKE